MHENSLFAVLMRKPWWLSALIALGLFMVARVWIPVVYAAAVPVPFMLIAAVRGWRQLNTPGEARVAAALEAVHALSWDAFATALEDGWRREGFAVVRGRGTVDFELSRDGRLSLVVAKRWKAARTGIDPLKELHAAVRAREAAEGIYLAAGEVTETARAFAIANAIRLVEGVELAKLTGRVTPLRDVRIA
ncbi:MAG: restriction endonuclease [Proteobacteria bacterium]|nr:restriction endonuclease [Pseudomonadota bacterium]